MNIMEYHIKINSIGARKGLGMPWNIMEYRGIPSWNYICFIIRPPTITVALFLDFFIFRKLILGSMTFWTLRPNDYIYFII